MRDLYSCWLLTAYTSKCVKTPENSWSNFSNLSLYDLRKYKIIRPEADRFMWSQIELSFLVEEQSWWLIQEADFISPVSSSWGGCCTEKWQIGAFSGENFYNDKNVPFQLFPVAFRIKPRLLKTPTVFLKLYRLNYLIVVFIVLSF